MDKLTASFHMLQYDHTSEILSWFYCILEQPEMHLSLKDIVIFCDKGIHASSFHVEPWHGELMVNILAWWDCIYLIFLLPIQS